MSSSRSVTLTVSGRGAVAAGAVLAAVLAAYLLGGTGGAPPALASAPARASAPVRACRRWRALWRRWRALWRRGP